MVRPRATLLRNGLILNVDRSTAGRGDVLVADGRIAEMRAGPIEAGPDVVRVNCARRLVMPGLINAHTHGHGSLGKGLGDLWTLELLLHASPWASGGFDDEDRQTAATLNAAEMVLKGVTAAYDMFAQIPVLSSDSLEAAARGYMEVGLRVVLAPMIADRSFYEAVPGLMDALPSEAAQAVRSATRQTAAAQIAVLRAWLDGWAFPRERVCPALGPTIPTHCTREFLEGCRDLARDFEVGIQMHLAESKPQAVAARELYGMSLPAYLDSLGLLGPKFTAAHCVWADDDDLARLCNAGARVAHNPGSNLRLGSGIARARAMADRGILVGIGSDGSVSSDNQNMFEAVRLASYASRATSPDPADWLSAPEVLRMGTLGGAEVLGFEGTGRIAPGHWADLLLLDLDAPALVPLNDPVAQIVQSEDSSAVRSVMVGGRMILDEGRFTTIDYPALCDRARAAAGRLAERTAPWRRAAEALAPVVGAHCVGLARRPHHVNRYCGC